MHISHTRASTTPKTSLERRKKPAPRSKSDGDFASFLTKKEKEKEQLSKKEDRHKTLENSHEKTSASIDENHTLENMPDERDSRTLEESKFEASQAHVFEELEDSEPEIQEHMEPSFMHDAGRQPTEVALSQTMDASTASVVDPSVEVLIDRLVQSCHVGQDEKARRVVLLDVVLQGKGFLRVRMKRTRQGVEVRLRADRDELTQLLRAHTNQLHQHLRERGVEITKVHIV